MCLRDVLSQMKANFFAALTLGSKMSEKKTKFEAAWTCTFKLNHFCHNLFLYLNILRSKIPKIWQRVKIVYSQSQDFGITGIFESRFPEYFESIIPNRCPGFGNSVILRSSYFRNPQTAMPVSGI